MRFENLSTASARMKVRQVIQKLEADGWTFIRTRGSHRQYKHPTKPGKVTVAGKLSDEVPPGTINNIWKQVNFKGEK